MSPHNFLIIVTGYRCAGNVRACYNSLLQQHGLWRAVFIDDGSGDDTWRRIFDLPYIHDKRLRIQSWDDNCGAAYHRFRTIRQEAQPDDIVVLLGMDDLLLPGALERIEREYDRGMLMTYGNWRNQNGTPLNPAVLDFDEETHEKRSYRKVSYRSTAPNTFKAHLFEHFKEEDFKVNGEWIKATTESPLMFGLLEMCGKDRIGVIKEPIYQYNMNRPDNARKRFGDKYQDYIYNEVISRPKKMPYVAQG